MTIGHCIVFALLVAALALFLFALFLVWLGEEGYKTKHLSFVNWLIDSLRPFH